MRGLLLSSSVAALIAAQSAAAADFAEFAAPPLRSTIAPTPAADVTIDASIGLASIAARELVYNTPSGTVLSKLPWGTGQAVYMFNMGIQWRPTPWIMMGARGSTNLTNRSYQQDYDFNVAGCPAAPGGGTMCLSTSPTTQLTSAWLGDVYIGMPYQIDTGHEIAPVIGFKAEKYRWHDYGGTANYLPGGQVFTGTGISYEQTWRAPYLGLQARGDLGNGIGYNARVSYSPYALGDDRDHHHLRSLLFTEKFGRSSLLSTHIDLSYALTPYLTATLGYDFQRWMLAKGPTASLDLSTGATTIYSGNAAGGSNESHMISVGLKVEPTKLVQTVAVDGMEAGAVNWSGFRLGVAGTGLSSRLDWRTTGLGATPTAPVAATAQVTRTESTPAATLFAGYDLHKGTFVAGLEADVTRGNANTYATGLPGVASAAALKSSVDTLVLEARTDASLRARLGFLAMPNLLIYATGGVAMADFNARMTCLASGNWCVADRFQATQRWSTGWTAGAGAEWAIGNRWVARLEYRYSDYARASHVFFNSVPIDRLLATTKLASQRVSLGLAYKFSFP